MSNTDVNKMAIPLLNRENRDKNQETNTRLISKLQKEEKVEEDYKGEQDLSDTWFSAVFSIDEITNRCRDDILIYAQPR